LKQKPRKKASTKNLVGQWIIGEPKSSDPDLKIEFTDLTFKDDGTCISDNKGKWKFDGQTITFTYKGESLTAVITNYETVEMTLEFQIDGAKVTVPMLRIA